MKIKISKNVVVLSIVSFFNDISSEMVYPIIPIFLTSSLGVSTSIVGLIEGISELTGDFSKIIFGWFSDKIQKRKIFTIIGYSFTSLGKLIIGIATNWQTVLSGRFIDRLGKGVRTSPRDALVVESSTPSRRGQAFGFDRALDTAGATLGPIITLILLKRLNDNLRPIFFIAFIPGLIGIVLLYLFVKEKKKEEVKTEQIKFNWSKANKKFKIFLLINAIFHIGNSSNAFLILRAKNLGLSNFYTILAYVCFNFTYAFFSFPAGILSDKIEKRKIILLGFLLFSIIYLFFGLVNSSSTVWILFPLFGLYMALTVGISKAYISDLVPKEIAGTSFGIYQSLNGICKFMASIIAGLLWAHVSVSAPFIFGSIMAMISTLLFIIL